MPYASEMDIAMKTYLEGECVIAIIGLVVASDTGEEIAEKLADMELVEDVFLVTGDLDILIKVRSDDYDEFKDFLINTLAKIEGIKQSKTFIVITPYKDRGLRQ